MLTKMRTLALICGISVAFLACSKNKEQKLRAIESDIIVSMIEGLTPANRQIRLLSRTAEAQDCYNFKILTSCQINDNQITINYKGIDSYDNVCLDAYGPATSEPAFPVENGVYQITLINENISNTAILNADDEKYVLEPQHLNNIVIEMDTLLRIPEYTYWLTIYSNHPFEAAAESFRNNLSMLGVNFKSYSDGDYGHFIIEEGEIVSAIPYGYDPGHVRMIFEFTGNIMLIKNLVSSFVKNNDISISINNYQGIIINSWDL